MDAISTAIEIIDIVYQTTIFIRAVIHEFSNYGDAKQDISNKLEHELVFVEIFSDVCFGEERGFLRHECIRDSIKRDVQHCLEALNKALAAYRAEAWKYAGVTPEMGEEKLDEKMKNLDLKEKRKRWRDGMKARCQVWRKKVAPLEWALFGKEEMESLLATYTEWTDRLRQTLSIIVLLVNTSTSEFGASTQAKVLGVKDVSERQMRVCSKPPNDYDALKGAMRDEVITKPGDLLTRAVYKDELGFDEEVLVEVRPYDEKLSLAVSERNFEEVQELKEPLRQLTWLLQSPIDLNLSKQDAQEGYRMHTLSCEGFIDEPWKYRSLILYRLPQALPFAKELTSLHASILSGVKPTLGNRFVIARALSATLLNIHTSGWVHKNICSRSVLMLSASSREETLPYLIGWDVARPLEANTSLHGMFELEPNLYCHQERFGKPSQKFSNEHDIYSLGVVLLEIGLWKTMSMVFARPLEKNPRIETTQQHALFKRVNGMIMNMAGDAELKREMGEWYAKVVQKCLKWQPCANQEEAMESSLAFRKGVVDALTAGSKL